MSERGIYINMKQSSNMLNSNIYSKMDGFSKIVTDKKALLVFLTIAKNGVRKIDEIIDDTNLELEDVAVVVKKLEKGDFIIKNPNPLSNKFRLGFNGQIFCEQLVSNYPDLKISLGKEKFIEPLKR